MLRKIILLITISLLGVACVSASAKSRNPFHPTVSKAQSPLTAYPLGQYKMVGIIDNDDQIWGIVRAPNNQLYSVGIGNIIGNEGGKVLQVTSQHITIQHPTAPGSVNIETLWLMHG